MSVRTYTPPRTRNVTRTRTMTLVTEQLVMIHDALLHKANELRHKAMRASTLSDEQKQMMEEVERLEGFAELFRTTV